MYSVFNMGHRLELYIPGAIAAPIIEIAASFGIDAAIIGHCESAPAKKLSIITGNGEFNY
jgi:phosphoribosylformylglycinamidine cyclo-ligase